MKKLSIIVPVYNVEKYIEKCLDSLVGQTLKDIEVIVVNDGSKDNCQKIIDNYKSKYPKIIKSIVKENGGQGSARNVGLSLAEGEYIAYVDSDDYVISSMFEKLYNNAKKYNSDISVCGSYVVDDKGKIIKEEVFHSDKKVFDVKSNPDVLFDKMAVWNKIYKKSFLESLNIQFRSKKWYEDFDFSAIALINAKKISVVEEPLYYYLLREGSTMNNSNIARNLEIIEAFDEILKYTEKEKMKEKYYEELEFLAIFHVYITTIVRILKVPVKKKEKLYYIDKVNEYMVNNFRNFKNNKYIKTNLDTNKKVIYYLINHKLYRLITIMFKIKDTMR